MGRRRKYPLIVREGSVQVKIYRETSASNRGGYNYRLTWVGADGVEGMSRSDLNAALEEARIKVRQLAKGLVLGRDVDRHDLQELNEARHLAGEMPLLSAMKEWRRARDLAGPGVIEACEAWSRNRVKDIARVTIKDAINGLIEDKNRAKKEGERTYRSKLTPVQEYFGADTYLDAVSAKQWEAYLQMFEDSVTRNDHRKRAVTLCRWAQKRNHLPADLKLEIEQTERANEKPKPIGIISPATYFDLLNFFQKKHPKFLAALVLAGFCGLRSDEIQGKRKDRKLRQRWEHIYVDQKYLTVSAAKENTPSSRPVALCDAALAWLSLCPRKSDHVCEPNAIERIRFLGKAAGFVLPGNCFRHSFITYYIAKTGNKYAASHEAGNSVAEIDRRYRVPRPKLEGEQWFALMPPNVSAETRARARAGTGKRGN